jgi:hypothetical protein
LVAGQLSESIFTGGKAMNARIEYQMSDHDHEVLMDACKPVVYMVVGVPPRSPQENANDAWAALGRKMGFDSDTVQPIAGKDSHYFTAIPLGEKP